MQANACSFYGVLHNVQQVSNQTDVRETNPYEILPGCVLPNKAAAIEELFDWSANFDCGKNPYCIFLDLIGFSEEEYGESMLTYTGTSFSQVLGYKELCMLGNALKVFEDEGYDQVYDWCRALEPGEVDDEEEDDEYHGPINYGNKFGSVWSFQ